ncbi:hypothetical protein JCM8547_002710 [Rhodosporidiobolus lusitaniae]
MRLHRFGHLTERIKDGLGTLVFVKVKEDVRTKYAPCRALTLSAAMPATLPSELLLAIFELALPSIETVSKYDEREKLLHSLCLVSRQFRDIAQPLLRRIFRPKENQLHLAASFPCLSACTSNTS